MLARGRSASFGTTRIKPKENADPDFRINPVAPNLRLYIMLGIVIFVEQRFRFGARQ